MPLTRRTFLQTAGVGAAGFAVSRIAGCASGTSSDRSRTPNIIVIFTDDQGYQDVGVFGSPLIETPNLDRMAADGMKFTDFHVGQPVCGPSRAALMTGCYPNRIGMSRNTDPLTSFGISDSELTMAELLKERGYATAIYGKWHLGHQPQFLPTRHGFDEYFGLPYSNDMWPPNNPDWPELPLMENEDIIARDPDQTQLTTWYTEHAVDFIERNHEKPFFIYMPHSMPHVPLNVSDKFAGKSKRGLYGDVIMEVDWSVGQVLDALDRHGIADDTLVVFTCDNGPWLIYGDHAGSTGVFREGKFTTFEGGHRSACIMRWPGRIPAGTICTESAMTIDLLPTFAGITGGALPDHPIDGLDIAPLMYGEPGAKTPHDALYHYWDNQLQAIRSGRWKLHLPHGYQTLGDQPGGMGGVRGAYERTRIELALFDINTDPGEKYNVADEHPDIVERLRKIGEEFDASLQANRREHGVVE